MAPRVASCQDLWQGAGEAAAVEDCPEGGGHGKCPRSRGFSLPPSLGELSRGREDRGLGSLHGEKSSLTNPVSPFL